MFSRFKRALRESYVGALAIGWTFASALGHGAGIVITPLSNWAARREYALYSCDPKPSARFTWVTALPQAGDAIVLFLLGYLLLRWLYYPQAAARGTATLQEEGPTLPPSE